MGGAACTIAMSDEPDLTAAARSSVTRPYSAVVEQDFSPQSLSGSSADTVGRALRVNVPTDRADRRAGRGVGSQNLGTLS